MKPLIPNGNRVYVRRLPGDAEVKSPSGLFLVRGKAAVERGEVVAIGPDVRVAAVGDIVVFKRDGGVAVDLDSVILATDEVLAKEEKGEKAD